MGTLKGLAQFEMFQLHKSIGISVLVLSILRLIWRCLNPPPQQHVALKGWQRVVALAVHWGFYAIMIGMPISGWIVVSTSPLNIPTVLFHVAPWPHFPGVHGLANPLRESINYAFGSTHMFLAFGTLVLLLLHLGAVIKHHFLDRDPILRRMLPVGRWTASVEL